jgi:hypothetical protein
MGYRIAGITMTTMTVMTVVKTVVKTVLTVVKSVTTVMTLDMVVAVLGAALNPDLDPALDEVTLEDAALVAALEEAALGVEDGNTLIWGPFLFSSLCFFPVFTAL